MSAAETDGPLLGPALAIETPASAAAPAKAAAASPASAAAPAKATAAKERRSPAAAAAAAPAPKVRVKVLDGHSVVHERHPSGFHKAAGPGTIIELDVAEATRLKLKGVVGSVNALVKSTKASERGVTITTMDNPKAQGPNF